jgi:Outer membrane protein beta-barrel domain
MKKIETIFTITSMLALGNLSFAQNTDNEVKNLRFGIKLAPSVNWYKPSGNIMDGNGAVVKFGGGLTIEYQLAKVISIQSGLQVDLDGGKIKYNNGVYNTPNSNTVSYYYNNLDDVISKFGSRPSDPAAAIVYDQNNSHLQLNERKFSVSYVTLPINLKMKTKEIGLFTYYGIIGINNSFRWAAHATDQVVSLDPATFGTATTKSKIDITKDYNVYNGSINLGAGAEMNLSGSTSLTFGLNYNLGFTNVLKLNSDYLEKTSNNAVNSRQLTQMPQQIKSNAVVLTVGVLF